MGERLGILGGTFDPVHVGHLAAAVTARAVLGLDRVLLVVANRPWQKSDRDLAPAEDRWAMVAAAVAGRPGLEASRIEIDRGGDTYTADTLAHLHAEDPDRQLFLVVGSDVAADLDGWDRPDEVARLATVAIVGRGGADQPLDVNLGSRWRVQTVDMPRLEVSSSELRERCAAGLPLDFLVPDEAITILRERGLYCGSTMTTASGGR